MKHNKIPSFSSINLNYFSYFPDWEALKNNFLGSEKSEMPVSKTNERQLKTSNISTTNFQEGVSELKINYRIFLYMLSDPQILRQLSKRRQ